MLDFEGTLRRKGPGSLPESFPDFSIQEPTPHPRHPFMPFYSAMRFKRSMSVVDLTSKVVQEAFPILNHKQEPIFFQFYTSPQQNRNKGSDLVIENEDQLKFPVRVGGILSQCPVTTTEPEGPTTRPQGHVPSTTHRNSYSAKWVISAGNLPLTES